MPNRHLSRMVAMQSLYEWDFKKEQPIEDITKRNRNRFAEEDLDDPYIKDVTKGVIGRVKELDERIQKAAALWPLEQISVVDKTILRLSAYELYHREDIPPKVTINEAVEFAKQFGGDNSGRFVNGVLGTLYRQSSRYAPEEEKDAAAESSRPAPSEKEGDV